MNEHWNITISENLRTNEQPNIHMPLNNFQSIIGFFALGLSPSYR